MDKQAKLDRITMSVALKPEQWRKAKRIALAEAKPISRLFQEWIDLLPEPTADELMEKASGA